MKKYSYLIIIVLISILVLTGCSLLSNISQVPVTEQSGITCLTKSFSNLVGLWHFDKGIGTTAYDSSGNPNDGTLMGGTGWTSGKFGQALSFDGVNGYMEVSDSTSLDITGAITIECWVKREQEAYQTLISKWSAVDFQRSYLVALTEDNNVMFWITSGGTWGTRKELISSGTVGIEWTHIAATYDGNNKMTIYIDNAEDLSHVTTNVPIFAGDAPLMFGVHPAYMTHGWVPGYFKGILDEVRIWNIALTEFRLDQVDVAMDIKPGSCPNPLNVKNQGVLPVAILGTPDFDVTQVDPATVKLEGVAPLCWAIEDIATPSSEECNTLGPDGYLDLTLKFDTQEILGKLNFSTSDLVDESEIVLNDLEDGDCLMLTLIGYLYDVTPIRGEDTVLIIKKGK
jgi:hypothetical protein